MFLIISEEECPCHEGTSDVIVRSSALRFILFLFVVFLVSCCTIIVLVNYFGILNILGDSLGDSFGRHIVAIFLSFGLII